MKIQFSQTPLNFPLPINLAGYLKDRTATTVNDPLYVSMCILEDLVLISIDGIGVSPRLTDRIKERIKNYSEIFVFGTHTHSGVKGLIDTQDRAHPLYSQGQVFGTYNEQIEQTILSAVDSCLDNLIESSNLELKQFKLDQLYSNRNDLLKPYEQRALSLESDTFILFHFACHPTILGPDNQSISSDLVGGLRSQFDKPVMFINGAAGDVSTRFLRQGTDFTECLRFGEVLKQQFDLAQPFPVNHLLIDIKHFGITARLKKSDDVQRKITEIEQAIMTDPTNRKLQAKLEGYRLADKPKTDLTEYRLNCAVIEINGLKFVTLPLEMVSELTIDLECYILGYANDYVLYMASKDSYENELYEALASPFEKGEAERLIQKIKEQL
ncbi:MAG: hypothetical protein GX775_06350 [Erysipelothrix sp.]|nr:hypothetical protein [Erysipelothrix sp.]